MEETETLERTVRDNEHKATELDAETVRKVQLLEQEQQELDAAVREREGQRESLVAAIQPDLLKRYDRVSKSKAGIAVAAVTRDRCSACLNPVPAQRVLEVERQDCLYSCEACGRILVVNQE
jgi:predicted  nucleic acid-binding Zn-ribbon protein